MKKVMGHTLKPDFFSVVKNAEKNTRMEDNVIRILKARSSRELTDITEEDLIYLLDHFEEVEDFLFKSGIFGETEIMKRTKTLPRVARRRIL